MSPDDLLRLEVPCDGDAPCVVREAFDQLEEIAPVLNDARLIASELVTNAVVHSNCDADETIAVRARLGEDCLTICVNDPGRTDKTIEIRPNPDEDGGFGLRIVQSLARRWGAERLNGHLVWAEIALS